MKNLLVTFILLSACVCSWADNKFDINGDGKVNSTDIVATPTSIYRVLI